MNLYGSFAKLQNSAARFYVELAQYFKENKLIRDVWLEMAHDKEQQIATLRSLPPSFWSELIKRRDGLFEAAQSCFPPAEYSKDEERSLKKCFAKTLEFEEPIFLKVCAPLIRQLRTEWTDHALDFYIMIKAHVARILRVVQSFSGDPILVQRASTLLQDFEKEVQAPEAPQVTVAPRASKKAVAWKRNRAVRKALTHKAKAQPSSRSLSLSKRTKSITPRGKPLVKGIELHRRRARR
jgi:hypothetical protein